MPDCPKNYRTNAFSILGKNILVGGIAGPHNNPQHKSIGDPDGVLWTFEHLKEVLQVNLVIGLHNEENFTADAAKIGLPYHYIFVEDYFELEEKKPISNAIFNEVFEKVKEATEKRQNVVIHCGSGFGRTGTALAALKLRELLKREYDRNPEFLNTIPQQNHVLLNHTPADLEEREEAGRGENIQSAQNKSLLCTPLVKEAIEAIRNEAVAGDGSKLGIYSVEIQNDADSLVAHEEYLIRAMQKKGVSFLNDGNMQPMKTTLFARDLFGDRFYIGSHPVWDDGANTQQNLQKLRDLGITKIYSLEESGSYAITCEWPNYGERFTHETSTNGISYFFEDYKAPSLDMLDAICTSILDAISKGEKIYMHCGAGLGRTGTVMAAICLRLMGARADHANDGIDFVRENYHADAIESPEQEQALAAFHEKFKNMMTAFFPPGYEEISEETQALVLPKEQPAQTESVISGNELTFFAEKKIKQTETAIFQGHCPVM